MAAVKRACDEAGVVYPLQVTEYFNNTPGEDIEYLEREMKTIDIRAACSPTDREYCDGMIVDLAKLPKDVKQIEVFMQH